MQCCSSCQGQACRASTPPTSQDLKEADVHGILFSSIRKRRRKGRRGGRGGERAKKKYIENMDQLSPNARCNFMLDSLGTPTMRHGCNRNKDLRPLEAVPCRPWGSTWPSVRAQSLNKESQGSLSFLIFLLTQVLFIRPVTVHLFFAEGGKSNRVA